MPRPYLPLETDLAQIAFHAAQRQDDDEAFGYYLDALCERGDLTDVELDALVESLSAEVTPQIDCTVCANCCRSLVVGLTPDDIPALAEGLVLPAERVVAQFVDRDAARDEDEWGVFRHRPCVFLSDRRCSIYAHRPASCRAYPTFTPDFRYLLAPIIAGAALCPIIYNVIERLKVELGW